MRVTLKKLIYNEKYHDNCFDYLKEYYLQKYLLQQYLYFFRSVRDKIPLLNICNFTTEDIYKDIIVCDQHAVIFTHHEDKYPVLATYALNACVGLLLYEPNLKIGSLAHIDGLPGYSKQSAIDDGLNIHFNPVQLNISIILRKLMCMKYAPSYHFDYYLVGGIFDMSEIMVYDIVEELIRIHNEKPSLNFNFKGRNLLGPENQSRNICFDTRSGEIAYFDFIANATFYSDNYVDELPGNILKAPRKNEALLDITYEPIINHDQN